MAVITNGFLIAILILIISLVSDKKSLNNRGFFRVLKN
jgi:hypothetical protein